MRPMGLLARPEPATARWAPRRRPGVLAWVLLAHGLLLLGWHFELMPRLRGAPSATRAAELVWLQIAPLPQPTPPPAVAPRAPAATPRPVEVHPRRSDAPPAMAPAPTSATQPVPTTETTAIHLPAPEPAASAASAPRDRLMDTAATRAAIRQTGRTALLSERAANAIDQPFVSKGEKEAQAVARAAKGHCLAGEFDGGGMGLLSIPFFVAAEVRGKCAR